MSRNRVGADTYGHLGSKSLNKREIRGHAPKTLKPNSRLGFKQCPYFPTRTYCNYPREIVKRALAHNAGSVILAHNHPSGEASPSAADRSLTKALAEALALVDVKVLDHFIVAPGASLSFAEEGLLY